MVALISLFIVFTRWLWYKLLPSECCDICSFDIFAVFPNHPCDKFIWLPSSLCFLLLLLLSLHNITHTCTKFNHITKISFYLHFFVLLIKLRSLSIVIAVLIFVVTHYWLYLLIYTVLQGNQTLGLKLVCHVNWPFPERLLPLEFVGQWFIKFHFDKISLKCNVCLFARVKLLVRSCTDRSHLTGLCIIIVLLFQILINFLGHV